MKEAADCRALLATVLLVASQSLCAAEWLQFENPYLRIYTDAGEHRTRPLVEELDRFRQAVLLIANWRLPVDAPPVEVLILNRGFEAIAGRTDVAGFSMWRDHEPGMESAPVLVMPAWGRRGTDERVVMKHQYVHALSRYRGITFPPWYREGIAEVFAYTRVDSSDVVIDVPKNRIKSANIAGSIGMDPIKSYDKVVELSNGQKYAGTNFSDFYLQAWLLTHYLTFGDPTLAPKLEKCLLYSDGGMAPGKAFKLAFGVTPHEMGRDTLQLYMLKLSGRRYKLAKPIVAVPFTLNRAPAGVAESRLATVSDWWQKNREPGDPQN